MVKVLARHSLSFSSLVKNQIRPITVPDIVSPIVLCKEGKYPETAYRIEG